jgi:hypothetical protein
MMTLHTHSLSATRRLRTAWAGEAACVVVPTYRRSLPFTCARTSRATSRGLLDSQAIGTIAAQLNPEVVP